MKRNVRSDSGESLMPENENHSFQKIPPRSLFQSFLIYLYEKQIPYLVKIQSYRNPYLDFYMRVATLCGDEIFYITILPLCSWIFSLRLALQLVTVMTCCITLGNMLKNTFNIPRPPHPPVQCLGGQDSDHGFPSTHTMCAVAFPNFIVWWLYSAPDTSHLPFSYPIALFLTFIYSSSIISSRVYNGHHSLTDVSAGIILGLCFLYSWINYGSRMLEYWTIHGGPYAPVTNFIIGIAILASHPSPDRPTSALGESSLVVGSTFGCIISLWIARRYSLFPLMEPEGPLTFLFSYGLVFVNVLRFVMGIIMVAIVRMLAKSLFTYLVREYSPIPFEVNMKYKTPSLNDTRPLDSRRGIDVPVKYLTYMSIALFIAIGAPLVFRQLGLALPVDASFNNVLPEIIEIA